MPDKFNEILPNSYSRTIDWHPRSKRIQTNLSALYYLQKEKEIIECTTNIIKMETTVNKESKVLISDKAKRSIVDIITSLYVLLFLYAATSKLFEYDKSLLQMSKSPIITDYAHILVWMVPALEIIISIMLLIKRALMLGLYAAFGLMSLFTAYIYAILNFTDSIPCSCGGVLEKLGWTEHLIFNIAFAGLAITGILLQAKIMEKKAV